MRKKKILGSLLVGAFLTCEGVAFDTSSTLCVEPPISEAERSKVLPKSLIDWVRQNEVGDYKSVKWCLENGADVNYRDSWGRTALYWACDLDVDMNIIHLLLQNGAELNIMDSQGIGLLSHVCCNNKPNIALLLLANGAFPHQSNDRGESPIVWAAKHGNLTLVEGLVDKGAQIETRDQCYNPLVFTAVYSNRQPIIEYLISKGASPVWISSVGIIDTVVHAAMEHNHVGLAMSLFNMIKIINMSLLDEPVYQKSTIRALISNSYAVGLKELTTYMICVKKTVEQLEALYINLRPNQFVSKEIDELSESLIPTTSLKQDSTSPSALLSQINLFGNMDLMRHIAYFVFTPRTKEEPKQKP